MGIREQAKYAIVADDQSAKGWNSFKRNVKSAGKAMGGLKTAIAGAVGAAGFGALIKGAIDAGDRVHKLSIKVGASTEFLSRMGHAANLSGTDMESVAKATQKMQKAVSEASEGVATYSDAFDALGINIEEFKGATAEEQFLIMTEALGKVENQSDKTKLAMDIMGKAGGDMLQIMEGGTEGIKAMWEEADKLGRTLTKLEAEEMAAANDAIERLTGSVQGVANTLAVKLVPAIELVAVWLQDAINWTVRFAETLGESVAMLVIGITDLARSIEGTLGPPIRNMMAWFESLISLINSAVSAVSSFVGTDVGAPVQVNFGGRDEVKLLDDLEELYRGGRAVGGTIPRTGAYQMHQGERVISNVVNNNNVSIEMQGGDMTPAGTRAWVRNVLMPEIALATR
jgi:rRNA maturation endonuclease Nob1